MKLFFINQINKVVIIVIVTIIVAIATKFKFCIFRF